MSDTQDHEHGGDEFSRPANSFPRVAVVVPIYNRVETTLEFLRLFQSVSYPNYEIIVVDDGSTDDSSDRISREFPAVRLLREKGDLWWAGATNAGLKDAITRNADFALTINDDVTFNSDFLDHLVSRALREPNTLVGAIIYEHGHSNRLWYAGGKIRWLHGEFVHRKSLDDGPLLWLTGMGTLIPIDVFGRIGFYDERHFPQYAADVDLTMRARLNGLRLAIVPESVIWNKAGESSQLIIRKNVTLSTFFLPLFSLRSDSMLRMRLCLYRRYWPKTLIPVALLTYYTKHFAKQSLRLLRVR